MSKIFCSQQARTPLVSVMHHWKPVRDHEASSFSMLEALQPEETRSPAAMSITPMSGKTGVQGFASHARACRELIDHGPSSLVNAFLIGM
jgi:hypothetical protein